MQCFVFLGFYSAPKLFEKSILRVAKFLIPKAPYAGKIEIDLKFFLVRHW